MQKNPSFLQMMGIGCEVNSSRQSPKTNLQSHSQILNGSYTLNPNECYEARPSY